MCVCVVSEWVDTRVLTPPPPIFFLQGVMELRETRSVGGESAPTGCLWGAPVLGGAPPGCDESDSGISFG